MRNTTFVIDGKVIPNVTKCRVKKFGKTLAMHTIRVCGWAIGCVWEDAREGIHVLHREFEGVPPTTYRFDSFEEAVAKVLALDPAKVAFAIEVDGPKPARKELAHV